MSLTFPVLFACVLMLTPFAACWWTWWLVRNSSRMDERLFAAMNEANERAAQMGLQTANITAEATRGIMESMKGVSHVLEQVGGLVVAQNPRQVLERVLEAQIEAFARGPDRPRTANGRFTRTEELGQETQKTTPAGPRPPGVKLPSEM